MLLWHGESIILRFLFLLCAFEINITYCACMDTLPLQQREIKYFNSLRPSDALWRQWSWTLPHIIDCLTLLNATAHSDAAVTILFHFARNSISIGVRGWCLHQTWPENADRFYNRKGFYSLNALVFHINVTKKERNKLPLNRLPVIWFTS